MNLSKGAKVALAIATAWPLVYGLVFIAMVLSFFFRAASGEQPAFDAFAALFVAHAFTALIVLGLLVFYVVHALKNQQLDENGRILWAVLLFVGSVIAMAVYFFLYVWPDPPPAEAAAGRLSQV